MNEFLISCVVPTLNSAATLDATLLSLRSQKNINLKIIVADSGSTDGTLEICQRWEVPSIYVPPGNMYQAINAGLRQCTSEWFTYLNSDDWIYPDSIARLLAQGKQSNADVVYGNCDYTDEQSRFVYPFEAAAPNELLPLFRLRRMAFAQPAAIFRRSSYEKLNGFDESLLYSADADFYIRALLAGNGVKPDVDRGMALLVKAAESGHTYAMNQLGGEYKFGRNIKADPSRSAAFFQESTDRGDVWGMVNLGLLYRDGVGVAKDGKRAMELFAQADEGGQPEAPRFLAVMMRAQGSSKPTEIAELFRKGAQRGDAWAAFLAAEMIKADTGLAKDASEATRLYALAASRGANEVSDKAMQALGHIDEVAVGKAVQEALSRLGQSIGKVDGKMGSRTLEAAASVLGEQPPANLRDLLVALTRKEWLASQPRLDML